MRELLPLSYFPNATIPLHDNPSAHGAEPSPLPGCIKRSARERKFQKIAGSRTSKTSVPRSGNQYSPVTRAEWSCRAPPRSPALPFL